MQAFMNAVSPGYFATIKTPFLEGRDFRDSDAQEQTKVAIVNRSFAEHFFPGRSAVGRHVGQDGGPRSKLDIEIVGVVADSLYEGPREGVHRQAFLPNWGKSSAAYYVRTQTRSDSAYALLRDAVRQLDASMPVYSMKTVDAQLDETLLTDRLVAMLSVGFGALATLLASIGLYGVMAFVVARRRKELGIRLALGAVPGFGRLARDARRAAVGGHRARRRRAGGDRARTLRRVAAVRHQAARSGDRRRDRHVACDGVGGGRIHSRRAREPDGSERGVEDRVGRAGGAGRTSLAGLAGLARRAGLAGRAGRAGLAGRAGRTS